MMSRTERYEDGLIEERLVPQLLARAIELDATADANVPLTEVKSIAVELGISETAVDAAVREVVDTQRRLPVEPTVFRWAVMGFALSTAIGSGYASSFGWRYPVIGIGLGVATGVSIGLAFVGGKYHKLPLFLLRNAGFWLGLTGAQVVAAAFGGARWSAILSHYVVVPMAALWGVTTSLGLCVIALKRLHAQRTHQRDLLRALRNSFMRLLTSN